MKYTNLLQETCGHCKQAMSDSFVLQHLQDHCETLHRDEVLKSDIFNFVRWLHRLVDNCNKNKQYIKKIKQGYF